MSATQPIASNLSAQAWNDLLADLIPPQGGWTEEQYLAFTDHSNRMIEFTDGCLEPLPMPTDKHQCILEFLYDAFAAFVRPRGGKVHIAVLRLRVRPGKFREPDLLLLRSARDPRRQDRFWTGADLVLEVVNTDKQDRDLIEKREEYVLARVPEYWIVNPNDETVTVLRLDETKYVEEGIFQRGERAASTVLTGFTVGVSEVLDAD